MLQELAEGSQLTLVAKHADGSTDEIPLTHTFNAPQIAWFKAGSALNVSPSAAATLGICPRNSHCLYSIAWHERKGKVTVIAQDEHVGLWNSAV